MAIVSAAELIPESDQMCDPGGFPTSTVYLNQHLISLRGIFMYYVDIYPNLLVQGGKRLYTTDDLESHAYMPVVGCNAYIISWKKKTVVVSMYSPYYEAK